MVQPKKRTFAQKKADAADAASLAVVTDLRSVMQFVLQNRTNVNPVVIHMMSDKLSEVTRIVNRFAHDYKGNINQHRHTQMLIGIHRVFQNIRNSYDMFN